MRQEVGADPPGDQVAGARGLVCLGVDEDGAVLADAIAADGARLEAAAHPAAAGMLQLVREEDEGGPLREGEMIGDLGAHADRSFPPG
ncbi:hypothetical protein D3C87_1479660 [compost metagenome]